MFGTVASSSTSRQEQLYGWLEQHIVVPWRVIWQDYRTRVGVAILSLYLLAGTAGVWILPPPEFGQAEKYLAPFQTMEYPLGADHQGRGLLRQTIHATPAMLKMMLAGSVFTTGLATIIGTVTGYKGGLLDEVLMYAVDVVMTIPGLPVIIILAASLEPENPYLTGILLSITAWAGLSRTIRSQVLSIREQSYVEASRTMGVSTSRIIYKDIVPNLMPYIIVNFVQSSRRIIFASVGLYFLGFLPFTTANWGVQLNLAYNNGALRSPSLYYWILIPMVAIIVMSFGLILFGQGTDRLFNPRIRARHESGPGQEKPPAEGGR